MAIAIIFKLSLPVSIRAAVAPSEHNSELVVRPGVQVHALDAADVRAHPSMYAGTADANENAQVPCRPARVFLRLAVCAGAVCGELDERLEGRSVGFGSVLLWWSSRHFEGEDLGLVGGEDW